VVFYGDKIELWAQSFYHKSFSSETAPEDARLPEGPIGYYSKDGRHGILSVVPPLFPAATTEKNKYFPSLFTVTHVDGDTGRRMALGYGDPFYLVDENGLVWNNKTGLGSGYIGPRPRGWRGEICIW
jgi:hypothetical protein